MNDTPATSMTGQLIQMTSVPFERIPGSSALFLDFLSAADSVSDFYPSINTAPELFARKVLRSYDTDRNQLCSALAEDNAGWGVGEDVLANIDRLREDKTVAVVTGQQAGLFTGPLYTIYKGASAVAESIALNEAGIPAVPVFWIASEDHDLDEIRRTSLIDRNGKLRKIIYGPDSVDNNVPVGTVAFDDSISNCIDMLSECLPASEFRGDVLNLVCESYRPGTSVSDAFARMLTRLFSGKGLVLVSPLNSVLRKLSVPFVCRAIDAGGEINRSLRKRDKELESAGYHKQVLVSDDHFPFFFIDGEDGRTAIRIDMETGHFRCDAWESDTTPKELAEIIKERPECISPNALMRPLIQDFLFPSVCYFGGSAEIAYFAQNSVLYELLGRPVTPIRHRAALTIVDPRDRRTMEKFGLSFEDTFADRDDLLGRLVDEILDPETADEFEKTEESINQRLDVLEEKLARSDVTLAESLKKRRKKILWHIQALKKKFRRSEEGRNVEVVRRIDRLCGSLHPNGVPQERELNVAQFISRHGRLFVDWICDASAGDGAEHKVLN